MDKRTLKALLLKGIPKEDRKRVRELDSTIATLLKTETHDECFDKAMDLNLKLLIKLSRTRRGIYTYTGITRKGEENEEKRS